jgi:chaperonin GroEL (HSP60 family)
MVASGIIDPKKVERVALEEAISLAGMFLTTES